MRFIIIIFIFSFSSYGFEDRINCLLKPEPYQSVCFNQIHQSQIPESEIDKNLSENENIQIKGFGQRLDLVVGMVELSPFTNNFKYGFRYGFEDKPWGHWRLGINEISSQHYLRRSGEVLFEKKMGSLSVLLGVNVFDEQVSIEQSFMRRTSLSLYLGAQYSLWTFNNFQLGFELGTNPPLRHDFKLSYDSESELTQELLMQVVNKLDQAWPISAQIGLSYLFD